MSDLFDQIVSDSDFGKVENMMIDDSPLSVVMRDGLGKAVRVRLFADGRVSVILYQFSDSRLSGKFFLSGNGTWHPLVEGANYPVIADVVRQVSDFVRGLV